jgi:hypothetical protein
VCGVNTLDLATEDEHASGVSSIAQQLWPAMGIQIDTKNVEGAIVQTRLVDMARLGWISDVGRACDHVVGIRPPNSGCDNPTWSL